MAGSKERASVGLFRPSVGLAAADLPACVRLAPDPTSDTCARTQIPALNVSPDSQAVALRKTQISDGCKDARAKVRVRKATAGGEGQRLYILLVHGAQTHA